MITRTFKLCLNAGTGSAPFINVSQTDKDEVWLFELYTETGERYIPSSGAIIGIKADGHGIANTGTVDSEGRVVITETEQMTAAAGRSIFELSIDGLTHGTANFIVNVEKKPIDGAIMSDSDLSLISQAIDSAAVIVDVIGDGDPSEVIGEHVDAWLDNHPEATTTVLDGAITAPKINNSLWDKLLVSEEASGNPASFDDGADDVPVSSLKVALEPIQLGSGDPSPSNVRPIFPANGVNLLELSNATNPNRSSFSYLVETAEDVTASKTASGGVFVARYVLHIPIDGSYTFTSDGLTNFYVYSDELWGTQVYSNKNTPTTLSFTAGTYIMGFFTSTASGTTVSVKKPMVSMIASASYQPYQGIMVYGMGKNLFDASAITPNKALSSNGNLVNSSLSFVTDYIPVSGKVLISYEYETLGSSANRIIGFYNANKEWLNETISYASTAKQHSYDVPADAVYMRMGCDNNYTNFVISDTGNTYPYTLGQSVYGGSVDLATGVLTLTHKYVEYDGSNDEAWERYNGGSASAYAMRVNEADILQSLTETICTANYLPSTTGSATWGNYNAFVSGSNSPYVYTGISTITTLEAWKTYLASNPLTIVLKLATPQTINLTPQEVKTLLGYNNISSSGTVEVIYHADTKLYVDKMTAVDNNIIAPTEVDFVATRNYTTNDLVIVNDTLYKVTANIASGSAITPNSNVQQTTLGALIKALS